MKKRGISIVVAMVMIFTFTSAWAERNIKIYVDGTELKCDSPAFIEDGNTMVPMRNIFEHLNAKVDWDNDTKTITAQKVDNEITLQIGSQILKKNGKSEQLDVTPVIVNDITFVPIRAVSQALDANVVWDDESSTISISSDFSLVNNNDEPIVTMYAPDGRTIDIAQSEVEAYENVGWYKEPVVLMYAADGRTRYTLQSEVEAYKNVGWYTEPYTPPQTNYSSGSGTLSGNIARGSTVYVTPKGKKYHYSASCAGKNARATNLSEAQASGKGPCSKCAR